MEWNWSLSIVPPAADVISLRECLLEYNVRHSNIADSIDMMVSVRDQLGQLVGGVTGNLWGRCLEIDFLWVHEDQRGHGLGKQILSRLEEEAYRRGCRVVFLNTYSFQAPDFYLK